MKPHAFGFPLVDKKPNLQEELTRPGIHIFANALTWTTQNKDPNYQKVLANAQHIFADGIATVLASKLHSHLTPPRLPGPDFTQEALKEWNTKKMLFVGGSPSGFQALTQTYHLTNTQQVIPPFREDHTPHILTDLKTHLSDPPEIVSVCLGAPKQEIWALHASKILPNSKFFPIGAAFDFLTNQKKRAPQWMRNWGLEWAFRLSQEPKRLFHRCFVGLPQFLILLIAFKLKKHP
jgi:N-acetylglucosaminyldiphosphoundecaprenol N-acetyl-beta-D-mannosaminyltransferase